MVVKVVMMGDFLTDDEFLDVVEAARAGEGWALTVLYRAHQPSLLRFLGGLVRDDAEDVASETWIDLARALVSFEGGQPDFRRLLYTIARRRVIDQSRKRQRRRTFAAEMRTLPDLQENTDVADVVGDLDSSKRAIRHISSLLPRRQAEVVLLRVVAGLTVEEVASALGIKPAAVSLLQTRALHRLAVKLGSSARWERQSEPQ